MIDAVKKEIMKFLEVGMFYFILDSSRISPVQVVPKKTGIIGWKIKMMSWFLLEFNNFLDEFSGIFQIAIAPGDQEKTTFTCPFGTFAYRRMPFGLCNCNTLP